MLFFKIPFQSDEPVQVMPLDFQVGRYASIANDFLYFMASSFDGAVLKEYFWKLANEHYKSFSEFLTLFGYDANTFCTYEQYKEEIRTQALFLLTTRIFSLPFFASHQIFDAFEVFSTKIPEYFYVLTDDYVQTANNFVEILIDLDFI